MDALSDHKHSFYFAFFILNQSNNHFLKVYILIDDNFINSSQLHNLLI